MAEVNASAPLCNDHEGLLTCRNVTDFRWQVSSPPDSCRRLMKGEKSIGAKVVHHSFEFDTGKYGWLDG